MSAVTDGKVRICGSCGVNPATHVFNRGRGGHTRVYRCVACVEHRSLSFIALRRYCEPLPRLAYYEGRAGR